MFNEIRKSTVSFPMRLCTILKESDGLKRGLGIKITHEKNSILFIKYPLNNKCTCYRLNIEKKDPMTIHNDWKNKSR